MASGAKFCNECGGPVSPDPSESERREVRKVVTIVFVDLAGSTSLQEHMDPESVRRVMERFYATMRVEIEAAGGLVVKFTGDGVMAGFGIREAREDDAWRAIRASVAMQDSFGVFAQEIKESRGADVSLRVGINTGEVVVSEGDDDVVGDVVNVAARLEHAAGDGNVLVGPQTWRLTRHLATFEAVAPLDLKGKAEPVPAYRVLSLQPPPEEDAVAPFVGRDGELGRLRDAFERCASSASPAIITIVGSPGLGKTRLAGELASSISGRATLLEARCEAAGSSTYAPIAQAFREAAHIPETAGGADVIGAIDALVPHDFPERDRVAKLVASLLGVGDPATPQETFWAVRRLLEGLSQARPVVLVVDDIQWAEPMLLDLLDHVVEWAKSAPVMIVALARPEIRDARPSLIDAGAIVLEGLDPDDTAELAQGLLGAHDLPSSLVRRILATTQGNPLFVRELLRMLVDDGVLSRDGERWVVTVEAEEIDVPPTIHALLSARIERLREHERAVVERASVVGQEFYRGAVRELVPPPVRSRIDDHLETLRRKELVEPEGSYWIDERVFRFHHVLIRDAAYRRLLKEARADLHERFADWLEAKVGELVGEHDEVIGYHLEQAYTYLGELGPLDEHAIELGRRASLHLASASRRALDRDDLAAAANLSERAFALTDDTAAHARILLDRCEALLAMGDVDAAAEAVGRLRARASDDRLRAWADCFDGQLSILTDPARLRETAELVEGAARRLEELKDDAGAAKGHAVHAQSLAHLGQFGACEAALDRALAAARVAGDRRRANAVLASAPLAALWGPSPVPRASGRCLDVVRVLRITAGAPAVEATALRCQAVLEAMRGRSDAAHRMLASARKTLEELGLRHALVECDMFAGLIDLFSGDSMSAEASLRSAYEGFSSLNLGTDTALAAALLARALVDLGRDDEALVLTDESERLGGDDLKTAIAWRTARARVLARRGELDEAIELARSAAALAEPTDALIDHADARFALADVLLKAGRDDQATAESRAGSDLYARKEATSVAGRGSSLTHVDVTPSATSPRGPVEPLNVGGVRAAPGVDVDLSVWDGIRRTTIGCDWDGLRSLLAPDYVFVDHRSGLRSEIVGGAAFVDVRSNMQGPVHDWDVEVFAAWTSDISLSRLRVFGDDWQIGMLSITIDRDGLRYRREDFDEDDFESAFARLDELAYDGSVAKPLVELDAELSRRTIPITAAGSAALLRVFTDDTEDDTAAFVVVDTADGRITSVERFDAADELAARMRFYELEPNPSHVRWVVQDYCQALDTFDWERVRRTFDHAFELDDHRPIGWGRVGIDGFIEHLKEAQRGTSRYAVKVQDWICLAPSRCAWIVGWSGVTNEGSDFDYPWIVLGSFTPSGLTSEVTTLDVDQVDEARRLIAGESRIGAPPRGGVRSAPGLDPISDVSIWERFRQAMLARDWTTIAGLLTDDHVYVDHRSGLRSEVVGRESFLEGIRATWQDVEHDWDIEVISEWSKDIVLSRQSTFGEGWERSQSVITVDRDGVCCRTELFDEDDASVFDRLDEIAGERVPPPSFVRKAVQRYIDAHNACDWDGMRQLFEPSHVLDDRRPLGWGRVDLGTTIEHFRQGVRSTKSLKVGIERWLSIGPSSCGYILTWTGTTEEGADFSYPRIVVASFGPTGRCTTSSLFELDQIDEASSSLITVSSAVEPIRERPDVHPRLAVNDAPGRSDELPTTRSRQARTIGEWFERFRERLLAGDHEGYAALCAEDFVADDRRPTLRARVTGRQVMIDNFAHVKDLTKMRLDHEVIATRGDRLEVRWTRYVGEDADGEAFDVPLLVVNELGDDGLLKEWVGYEVEDLPLALAELDERYAATLPLRRAEIIRALSEHMAMYNRHDWERYASTFALDVKVVDHRPAGWGEVSGIEEFMQHIRALIELLPDARVVRSSIERLADEGVVATIAVKGTHTNGGDVEFAYHAVVMFCAGKISVFELFPIEDLQAALARHTELTSKGPTPTTTISSAWARLLGALNDRDMNVVRDMLAPSFRLRSHIHHLELDRDGMTANIEQVIGVPGRWHRGRAFTFGDRHGVIEIVWSSGSGHAEVRSWDVVRCDEDGRLLVSESFPENDLVDAVARTEELYLEDEADYEDTRYSRNRLRGWRGLLAYNCLDWDAYAEAFDPDVVSVDHRHAGWGELQGVEAFMTLRRSLADVAQHRLEIGALKLHEDVVMLDLTARGKNAEGGEFELSYIAVYRLGDGGVTRQEYFDLDQRAIAERRFAELVEESRTASDRHPIERAWDRLIAALNDLDADALRELHAPGFRQRQMHWHVEVDLEEIISRLDEVYAPPTRTMRGRSLALGSRHGVMEMIVSSPGGRTIGASEAVCWIVFRFDEQGKIVLTELYSSESDFLTALDRLEELYLEDEASGDEAMWSTQRRGVWRTLLALNEGADPAELAERFPVEVVMHDRRSAGFGELRGNDAWVRWQSELIDTTRDRRWDVRSVRFERNVLWLDMAITGTNEGGGRVEIPFIRISRLGNGISELFAPEQRDEAEKRFTELVRRRARRETRRHRDDLGIGGRNGRRER